jgi:hypothetical protein
MIKLKSLLLEDVYEYFYHATSPNSLPGIVDKGLIPPKETNWGGDLGKFSEGKVFATDRFRDANFYGNVLWRKNPSRFRPILRFKYDKSRFIPDKQSSHDFYVEYPLKARFEIFIYSKNQAEFGTMERNGDIYFNEKAGEWRLLTKDIADSIATGEWDDEEWDDEI